MNRLLFILSFLFSITCLTSQSWSLPACPSSPPFKECHGSYTYENGNIYQGEWKNNEYSGKGQFFWNKTGSKYIGQFYENKRHGKGTYIFGPNTNYAGDTYIGEYKDDKQNGKGVYIFSKKWKICRRKI